MGTFPHLPNPLLEGDMSFHSTTGSDVVAMLGARDEQKASEQQVRVCVRVCVSLSLSLSIYLSLSLSSLYHSY